MSSKVPFSPVGSGFPNLGPCAYEKSTLFSPEPIKLFSKGKNMCTLKFEKAHFYLFIDFLLLIPIWEFFILPNFVNFSEDIYSKSFILNVILVHNYFTELFH